MLDPVVAGAGYRMLAARLRGNTVSIVVGGWASMEPTDANVRRWVSTMAPVLDAAQHRIGAATSAYLAQTAPSGLTTPVGITAEQMTSEELRGVIAEDLLMRAPEQMWTALGEGAPPPEAQHKGALRALAIVLAGLQLAHTHSSRHVLRHHGVRNYTRRTRAGSCDLCSLSASQVYDTDDLMPIHDGCACSVVPVWGDDDLPDRESRADEKYEDEVDVHQHGELGPVLTYAEHAFRGPAAVP